MKTKRNQTRAGLGFWLGIGLLSAATGCFTVSTPKSVEIGGRPVYKVETHDESPEHRRTESQKVTKDEAYTIAREQADRAGAKLRDYNVYDKKIDDNYWVLFEHKRPNGRNDWQNYFAVRVSLFGRAELYKGRTIPKTGYEGRRIKKEDAYDIAHRVAYRENVAIRHYNIHDKEIDGDYWVLFESKDPRKDAGWKNHFAVRVSRLGRAYLYR